MTKNKKIISFPDNLNIKLSGIDAMRLHDHGQAIFVYLTFEDNIEQRENSFLINRIIDKGTLDFQITDFMFNKVKGFHGPFKSKLIKESDYAILSEKNFFKKLSTIISTERIHTPKIDGKRKKSLLEKENLIAKEDTVFYFLEKEISAEALKFEHEWSHALTEYYEFLLINNSSNNIFSLLLAYD